MKRQKREPRSLKRRLLTFMILCWLFPIAVFFAFTTLSYRNGIVSKTDNLMEQQLINISSVVSIRLDEAISRSQHPSYAGSLEKYWGWYRTEILSKKEFLSDAQKILNAEYIQDDRFHLYAFYMNESEWPDCYRSRIGRQTKNYVDEVQEEVAKIMALDSDYAYIKVINGRIYIVRNLYTVAQYERFGTLVLELNQDKLFGDIQLELTDGIAICVDDANECLYVNSGIMDDDQLEALMQISHEYDGISNNEWRRSETQAYNGYLYQKAYDKYNLGVAASIKRSSLYDSLYTVYGIVCAALLLAIPLMTFGVFFLWKQIHIPVKRLVKASNRMESGEIGILLTGKDMPNKEFAYLMKSFNSMSMRVKELFDKAYTEKLARKDAQILALQAQINPHFLNNTLEMMNWQARMSGDAVIPKMIEALGNVLDYRMNRSNVKEIRLTEELYCTDSYFYIMSMRFGQRLQIIRDIDDSLLYIMVPPLILQPVVENAIMHGLEAVKSGTIELKIFHDETNVYLRVINSGKPLTEKDRRRIDAILAEEADQIPKQPGQHVSIGISNVNRRIKLVYGEEYGLTIERGADDRTVSTVTIPYRTEKNGDKLERMTKTIE